MNAAALLPATPHEGGHYAGQILVGGATYALIVAPKAEGERAKIAWHPDYTDVQSALSYCDGLANTQAMAEAGSPLARWALGLRIGGHTDWYIPALDELEVIYRALKPSTDRNSCYARSGINLHSLSAPSHPYTPDLPTQTEHELFRAGGPEAFELGTYWTSTQHASISDNAWSQVFNYGGQVYWDKDGKLRARAVRRLPI